MLHEGFITEDERTDLVTWIDTLHRDGEMNRNRTNHTDRQVIYLKNRTDIKPPQAFYDIESRLKKELDLDTVDVNLGHFIASHGEDSYVQSHTDYVPNAQHHRILVMLQKPEEGGNPVHNGKIVDINNRDALNFRCDIIEHTSIPVRGNTRRLTVSYGFNVSTQLN